MKYADIMLSERPFDMREGDDQPKGSRYAWRVAANTARRLGVDLTQVDVDRLYYYQYLAMVIDGPIDSDNLSNIEREEFINGLLLSGDISLAPEADRGLLDRSLEYIAHLPVAVREKFVDDVLLAMSNDPAKRDATTLGSLVKARLAEADRYAQMLNLDAPDGAQDDIYRRRFNYWLQISAHTGYLIDTLMDLGDDYSRGEISLPPEVRYKVELARLSAVKTVEFARLTPVKSYPDLIYYFRRYNQRQAA